MQSDTCHAKEKENGQSKFVDQDYQSDSSTDEASSSDNVFTCQVPESFSSTDDSCRASIDKRQAAWDKILYRKIPDSQGNWIDFKNSKYYKVSDRNSTGSSSPNNLKKLDVDGENPAGITDGKETQGPKINNNKTQKEYFGDWLSAEQVPSKFEKNEKTRIKEDIDFLEGIGETEDGTKRFNHHNLQKTNAFQKLKNELPKRGLRSILNTVASSDSILKLKIVNPFLFTRAKMEAVLKKKFTDFADQMESHCHSQSLKFRKTKKEYCDTSMASIRNHSSEKQDLAALLSNKTISHIGNLYYEASRDFSSYIAAHCIQRARIVENQIYFPLVGDSSFVSFIMARFAIHEKEIGISVADITRRIDDFLLEVSFPSEKDKSKNFSFKKNTAVDGSLLCVMVTHLPMESPKFFFQRNFLTSLDRILKVVPQPNLTADGKVKTYVVIDIGSDVVPPKRLMPDRLRDRLIKGLKSFDKEGMIEFIEAEMEWLTKNYEARFPEKTKKLKSEREIALKFYKNQRQLREEKIQYLSKISPNKPLWDINQMNVRIVYSQNF